MDAAAWGLVGTLVGALASMGTTWIASTVSRNMQSDKQQEERREKAKEFQRATLIEIQEAMHDAIRLHDSAYLEEVIAHVRGGNWGDSLLSEEVTSGLILVRSRLSILIERVDEHMLRTDLKAFQAKLSKITAQREKEAAENIRMEVSIDWPGLSERVGACLRAHY